MEGNGPLRGFPKPLGVIMGGDDPLAMDVVAATLMGFDWRRIRMLKGITDSKNETKYSAFAGEESSVQVISNASEWSSLEALRRERLDFHAPSGWREYVEMQNVG
jgi:uncharacterized protein (DUF362 family)